MTPEKLNSWIYRPVTNSRTLTLVHVPLIGQENTIATWTREDVELAREQNGSQGQDVLDYAREHMETSQERDTCKFVLAWWGERSANALRATTFKLKPDESALAAADASDAISSAAMSGDRALVQLIPVFLNHMSHTQRATIGSLGVMLAGHERTSNMQQKVIDGQNVVIEKLLERIEALAGGGARAESAGVSEAKARALDKLTNALPELVSAGVQIAAGKFAPPPPPMPPRPPELSRDQLKERARSALAALRADEIVELVNEPDEPDEPDDNGAADDPQH